MEISVIADYATIIGILKYLYDKKKCKDILKLCFNKMKPQKPVILSNEDLFNYSSAVRKHNYLLYVDPEYRKFCLKSWWEERNNATMPR